MGWVIRHVHVHDIRVCHIVVISHQVVSLCWSHGLYDAILYIYNTGLRDFTTPLAELLDQLRAALATGKQLTETHIRLGNKLLVYISCCLAGRAYPFGDIPPEIVPKVKQEVFDCVSCLHTKTPTDDEPIYPYLKALLQYDTREFFNVLAIAFEEPEFQNDEGMEKRQRIVDILLRIMVESSGFTPTQVSCLFTFLARQTGRAGSRVMVNRALFEQVVESLCVGGDVDAGRHEERQQALLELLAAGGLEHYDGAHVTAMARNAGFFRVCEFMYEKSREFDKILSCYWEDTARQHKVFAYIEQIMTDNYFSAGEKAAVKEEAIANLQTLVGVDAALTAALVLGCLGCDLSAVVRGLRDDEDTLYALLTAVFSPSDGGSPVTATLSDHQLDPAVHELYIDLMCKMRPAAVYPYIRVAEGYRLDETLQIVQRYSIADATAYLLEKTGDVEAAFSLMLDTLTARLGELSGRLTVGGGGGGQEQDGRGGGDLSIPWADVSTQLLLVIQLCQRASPRLDERRRAALWFPLLDAVVTPQRALKDVVAPQQAEAFKELTRHVLNSMMGYIALPAILQKIMQDPAYSSGKFGDIKELILGMLDTYNYEKTLLRTCTNLVHHDLHLHLSHLAAAASRGTVPRGERCTVCTRSLNAAAGSSSSSSSSSSEADCNVVCFRCGHSYHEACLRTLGAKVVLDGEDTWVCYVCNAAKKGRLPSTGRIQRQQSSGGDRQPPSPGILQQSSRQQNKQQTSGVQLEPEQVAAIDALRRSQRTASRLAILTELSKQDRGGGGLSSASRFRPATSSILHNEHFQLRVAHPPPNFS